jgi:predicted Zn-dependent peptidase
MPVFERQTLSNGLRLLTAPIDHAQSVSCFIMLAAGSRLSGYIGATVGEIGLAAGTV